MSLSQKLLKVVEQVERVPKSGYNAFNKYNYVQEADLLDYIRPLMVQNHIIFGFNVEEIKTEESGKGIMAYAKCRFSLIDADNPEDRIESTVWGSGYDTQDKGLYKAYTGATKYFLMKSNLVSTGDDPERDEHLDKQEAFKNVPASQAQGKVKKVEVDNDSVPIANLKKEEREGIVEKFNSRLKTKEQQKKMQDLLINGFGVEKLEDLTSSQARKVWVKLDEAV